MNRKYNLKLDLQFRCNNSTMKFNQFDNNTSDFFIKISSGGKSFDVEKALVVLATIKPSGKVASQFIEIENDLVYADLKPNMRDEIGMYTAQAMLILEDERVVTDVISYEVEEDKIFSLLNDSAETAEEFTLLTDMLSRLSTIEISEEQRVINEAERILSEENRKIEEAKRVEAELIRQHEEADRAKYDATRESNENIRKQNESIRLANETNRIDEEAKRVDEENKRKLAEEERNANYNFMTEDEERRRSEANVHKEAEVLRVQAETNRVNEEAKRRTTEQGRVSAENARVDNENVRKANELSRKTNETHRVEAETQRQNRYNSFIADAEANASNFENYTNTAKVKEEERKSNELDRKSQEDRRVSNEVERISNENTRKANEKAREKNETSRQYVFENKVNEVDKKIIELNTTKDNFVSNINTKVDTKISELNTTKDNFVSSINTKVDNKISEIEVAKSDMTNTVANKIDEVENRFNALTSKQQQDAEVIDARDNEVSLKARLDRDIEKAKQVYAPIEGNHISTDSSSGYLKDVVIFGNTIQDANNLADIRSVGDKVEGQELYEIPVLSCGKNLFDGQLQQGAYSTSDGSYSADSTSLICSINKIKVYPNKTYSFKNSNNYKIALRFYDEGSKYVTNVSSFNNGEQRVIPEGCYYMHVILVGTDLTTKLQIEEGTVATPYEPYIEDKLTILSPVQVEKVGDVRDRIICKDGVWGVEKNVKTVVFDGTVVNGNVSSNFPSDNSSMFYIVFTDTANDSVLICDKFPNKNISHISNRNIEGVFTSVNGSNNAFYFRIFNDKLSTQDITGFKQWLSENNVTIKYKTVSPTFIPLPHDQQIKLRTFANKTNISFLTEIEGTIKAQVPKSIGATVNTHTEQINNLNKELDRVKKLEESTVSTVETESDFTTVEATSNGYFEDVKLEGKTLVNLCNLPSGDITLNNSFGDGRITPLKQLTSSDTLYLTFNCTSINSDANLGIIYCILYKDDTLAEHFAIENHKTVGYKKVKIVPKSDVKNIIMYLHGDNSSSAGATISDVMLMYEKDYDVQNPPSYFEGLKSVGQSATTSENGADEIVVSSCYNVADIATEGNTNFKVAHIKRGITYSLSIKRSEAHGYNLILQDKNGRNIKALVSGSFQDFNTFVSDVDGILFFNSYDVVDVNEIMLLPSLYTKETMPKYKPYAPDKKRLLYYNNETQTWEKPILREWDSIEKHADGKYYYHQRSGEVVLNGSENWGLNAGWSGEEMSTNSYYLTADGQKTAGLMIKSNGATNIISEVMPTVFINSTSFDSDCVSGENYSSAIYIRINKSKVLNGIKPYLQQNPMRVVYQLAEEKVYECTNIDLITYANETNFIVESSALSPKTTLKVHSNISNVVSLLQKKVSLLESNVKASQEVQDMMILETDMRMLDIELALMEFIPMKLNLGGSNMLRSATYFNFLKNHIINETYEKEYLENVMNKYLATGRINQDEYNELYKMLYPPVYDIELPIEY